MLKKTSVFLIAAACLALSSCESFLSVDLSDQANIEEVFSKSETTHRYLSHIY